MTVPNWKMERYLLGELPASEMAALKTQESESAEFSSQIEWLRNSNEELLAEYPAKGAAEKMQANLRKFAVIEPVKSKWLVPLSACAAILITMTALITVFSGENTAENGLIVINEDGIRVKGLKTGLEIWRKISDSVEKLSNNSEARAGDLLQMRYIAEEKCYGILLSIDGNGTLTVHLSGEHGKAAKLEAGKIISLESSYELDDAPRFETFYFFTSKEEFALASVKEAILNGKAPKNLQVSQITLRKK